jgi:4-amino-4-deoxy-L-arabinose transferase-like glycosyltransferase
MQAFLTKNSSYVFLNFIAILGFLLFHFTIDLPARQDLIFSTPDATTYRDVAQWIAGGIETNSLSVRPLIYPFLLLISLKTGGTIAVFLMQSFMWLAAINLSFASIHRISKKKIFAFIGAFVLFCNLSVMALTAHAITEITTIFLLSLTVFLITKNHRLHREPKFLLQLLLMLTLLTLVKPVFYVPTLITLLVLIFFQSNTLIKAPKRILILCLILVPLLSQMTLMKMKYEHFTVSLVGSQTFSRYFVTQGIEQIEKLEHQKAVTKADGFSSGEKMSYLFENSGVYFKNLRQNIKSNIQGEPIFLNYPAEYKNPAAIAFMDNYNELTYYLHILMLILGIVMLVLFWRSKNYPYLVLLFVLLGLNSYYLIVSGVSFWQGDRLTLPSIAIWSVLYPTLVFWTWHHFKSNKKST